MLRLLVVVAVLTVPVIVRADPPKLEKVDTKKAPLKLSAPVGWEVHTRPPRHEELSTIAGLSPSCPGVDVSIAVQLDQKMTKPSQLLDDEYRGVKPVKLHGWDCVVREAQTEVMCAGKVQGAPGVIGVYFATTSAESYKRFGDPGELTSQIAASISWSGKLSGLVEWKRDATDAAKASCK